MRSRTGLGNAPRSPPTREFSSQGSQPWIAAMDGHRRPPAGRQCATCPPTLASSVIVARDVDPAPWKRDATVIGEVRAGEASRWLTILPRIRARLDCRDFPLTFSGGL
jgi:hypothetical protein